MGVISVRRLFFFVAALCAAMLLIAILYFELALGIAPCALCVVQRVNLVAVGAVALAAGLHNPRRVGRSIYAGVALLLTAGALAVGIRHVWMQYSPAGANVTCGPGLDLAFKLYSPFEAIAVILGGSGDCGEIQWALFGLSIPAWTVVGFVVVLVALIMALVRRG